MASTLKLFTRWLEIRSITMLLRFSQVSSIILPEIEQLFQFWVTATTKSKTMETQLTATTNLQNSTLK